jgi:hypothetical protein
MTAIECRDDFGEGIARGAINAKIGAILRALGARHLNPTKKQLSRVAACTDLATLDRWFERTRTAATAAEVFKD